MNTGLLALAVASIMAIQVVAPQQAIAANYALLMGISDYHDENVPDLEGPQYDLEAMKTALLKWGFEERYITVLKGSAASKSGILAGLDRLYEQTKKDDQIFVYFSGHGTSRQDDAFSSIPLPYGSGALVPYDFSYENSDPQLISNSLIIGKRDIRPRMERLDKGGRFVFVVFDSCFSGSSVRGGYDARPKSYRYMATSVMSADFDGKDNDDPDEEYPYRNIVYFSAASANEYARDFTSAEIQAGAVTTFDNKPHGAFSDALLRGLNGNISPDTDHNGKVTYGELFSTIESYMAATGISHSPQLLPVKDKQLRKKLINRNLFQVKAPKQTSEKIPVTSEVLTVKLQGLSAGVKSRLAQSPFIRLVESSEDVSVKAVGRGVEFTSGGDRIVFYPRTSDDSIIERLLAEATFRQKLLPASREQSFNIDLSLLNPYSGSTLKIGDKIGFSLESQREAYAMLINFNTEGKLDVLYPYDIGESPFVSPAEPLKLDFGIRVTPPIGIDQVIAIAFDSPIPEIDALRGKRISMTTLLYLMEKYRGHWSKNIQKVVSVNLGEEH